jgi:hypothetical protein
MKREPKPVPLILDLWSLGHSASQIAEMVGLPNHRQVTRIIRDARSIGDKRAVLHKYSHGDRLIGRPGRDGAIARRRDRINDIEVVPAIERRNRP